MAAGDVPTMKRRVKFILTEVGNPFHIQVTGAWVLVFAGLFVYLTDAFTGFAVLAAIFAGTGVALVIQADKLKAHQECRRSIVSELAKNKEGVN